MHILPSGGYSEDLFWQARFDLILANRADPILQTLAAIYIGRDISDYIGRVESPQWRAFLLATERIQRRGRDIDLLLEEVDESVPYVKVMAGYYRATLDYRAGIARDDVASHYDMDGSTVYGTAIARESQAWHDQLRGDFHRHMEGMWMASRLYMACDPPALHRGGKALAIAQHLSVEMCNHGIFGSLRGYAESLVWPPTMQREKSDSLRAMALWAMLTGQSQEAKTYARLAKCCNTPRLCIAQALLLAAKVATYADNHALASDQIQSAAEICDSDDGGDCPERRSVLIGLAMQMIPINASAAKRYLLQYHSTEANSAMATSHDHRLDAISNIVLGRIARLNGEHEHARKTITSAHQVLLDYGYAYWAAIAASEVALCYNGTGKNAAVRQQWTDTSLELLSKYSSVSDVYRYIERQRTLHCAEVTERENEVLSAIHEGLTNAEIAHSLSVSTKTVEATVTRLLRKYNVKNRSELVHKTALSDYQT